MTDTSESGPAAHGRKRRALWIAAGALWLVAVVAGLSLVAGYDNRPGPAADAPREWPHGTRLALDATRPTLVMLAHPRCVCTRASLTELAELMARAPHRPKAYVVFIKPGGVAHLWEQTDLWQSATRIPDVTVMRDDDGVEAHRFGARTSGQTLLYGQDGRLQFAGGTTGARGHTGNNHGRATLLALLSDQTMSRSTTPVFGCSLFDTHDELGGTPSQDSTDGPRTR